MVRERTVEKGRLEGVVRKRRKKREEGLLNGDLGFEGGRDVGSKVFYLRRGGTEGNQKGKKEESREKEGFSFLTKEKKRVRYEDKKRTWREDLGAARGGKKRAREDEAVGVGSGCIYSITESFSARAARGTREEDMKGREKGDEIKEDRGK